MLYFISEGYVYLASIDDIIKIKGPRILPWSHEHQIHNNFFENDPQFSIVQITRRPIRQKTKENLFSILKLIEKIQKAIEDYEPTITFFLIFFYVDDYFDYFGGHIGYDFGTIMCRK